VGQEICAEFNPVLARPGREEDVARAVVAAAGRLRGWDQLRADGVPEDDVAAVTTGWPADRVRVDAEPAPRFLLAGLAPDGDVPSGLSGGARRRARASLRALEARGAMEVEWATDRAHATDVMDELVALHQARWTADGEPGLFAPGRFARVHRELGPRLAAEGRAVLFRLRSDGHTVGCLYHFVDDDRLAFYQSGFAVFDDNRLRPGLVTHLRCMDEARARGFSVYDFLAGDVRYKRDLSNASTTTCRVALRRRRLRLWGYDAARILRGRLRGGDEARGTPE
jgi:CelD/BcsL family acetyltransferase involved in cellulose biosynthesis